MYIVNAVIVITCSLPSRARNRLAGRPKVVRHKHPFSSADHCGCDLLLFAVVYDSCIATCFLSDAEMDYSKGSEPAYDWYNDTYWRSRRLCPSQLQVHDIRLEGSRRDVGAMLEMREVLSSSLLPDLERRDDLANSPPIVEATTNHIELKTLANEFGWLNVLRGNEVQETMSDPQHLRKCRWIHISSKFSDYLSGCLVGLSDWTGTNADRNTAALQQLNHCINQQERFSKHGRYFAPFFQHLGDDYDKGDGPMLLSVPFLDWGVGSKKTPPLRFQIDPREGFQSSRSTSHLLRSILQHFYRLEDTSDRESLQVFTKHKPWKTDRNLDLKVQRFYGQYPTSLLVDELWILVIDSRHIVTFSSNQSWKSRWPPLQVAARIMEVSFRGIRNSLINTSTRETEQDYTSPLHVIAALNGALGMLHRSFWTDITLCLSDRYASYLSHLQYRLLRSPNSKLVMDLLQVQEELNIVISIMEQQMQLVANLQEDTLAVHHRPRSNNAQQPYNDRSRSTLPLAEVATYRQVSFSRLADPAAQLLENLQREYADLVDLRENSNALINRTIQLVNMRLEDHGKAILVFTIVTIIFLPLSFISSFFGMNFSDIRNMESTQRLFWIVACSLTAATVGFSMFLAFYGGAIIEWFVTWREARKRRMKRRDTAERRRLDMQQQSRVANFEVLDALRPKATGPF
jgi:Mg2+ and Co2+ transporter CorA